MLIIETGSGQGWEESEISWVSFFRGLGFNLMNITIGGATVPLNALRNSSINRKGRPLSEEHRRRVSESLMGRPVSQSTRDAIANKLRGKPLSEAHKEKARKANLGKKHKPETIEKMIVARTGVKRGPMPEWWRKKLSECERKPRTTPMSEQERINRCNGQRNRPPTPRERIERMRQTKLSQCVKMTQEQKDHLSKMLKGKPKPPRTPEHAAKITASRSANRARKLAEHQPQFEIFN
jgi:hypothetical protein